MNIIFIEMTYMARRSSSYMALDRYHDAGRAPDGGVLSACSADG